MDRSKSASGPKQVPAVEFGGVKFFFFSTLAYDGELAEPHPGGISHVAFMVDDLDELVANLSRQGIEPFRGPYEVDVGDLGRRKVVFYRSPNGTILEPQELLNKMSPAAVGDDQECKLGPRGEPAPADEKVLKIRTAALIQIA